LELATGANKGSFMKKKGKTVNYSEEPEDDLSLPDDAEILTRKQESELGIPSPEETVGHEWERTTSGKKVTLKSKRGGARPGAGRKPKGHLRMQVLVSKMAKDKISRLAKKRGVPMSTVVSEEFEKYKI
jgi:hypothetical protein